MKRFVFLGIIAGLIIAACSTSKKSTNSTANTSATNAPVAAPTESASSTKAIKPADGIYEPGNDELTAAQANYKDLTLETLKQGYILYVHSACVSCHQPVNIYNYDMMKWQFIINDMAYRAKLTSEQRDAVFKYVFAIKATKTN